MSLPFNPISFIYPAVIIPEGKAIIAIPNTDDILVTILPATVTGYISPYPTVVNETVTQYIASKNSLNESGSTVNITKAETITYPIANVQTAHNDLLELLNTFARIP